MSSGDIDMVNRDPNGINAHLGVSPLTGFFFYKLVYVLSDFDVSYGV